MINLPELKRLCDDVTVVLESETLLELIDGLEKLVEYHKAIRSDSIRRFEKYDNLPAWAKEMIG